MTSTGYLWWLHTYYPPLFDALAYAGRQADKITQLVWMVTMQDEMVSHRLTAGTQADTVVELYAAVADDMPDWAGFVTAALAPTAFPAYRWLTKRAAPAGPARGVLQLVPSTFGRER